MVSAASWFHDGVAKTKLATKAVRAFVAGKGFTARIVGYEDGKCTVYPINSKGGITFRPGARSVEAKLWGEGYQTLDTTRGSFKTVVGQAYGLARARLEDDMLSAQAAEARESARETSRQAHSVIEALGG